MNSLTIPLRDLTADFPALTGVSRARRLLATLIAWTADHTPKGTLILDFTCLDNASASFLREAVLAFRDYVRAYQPDVFPVLANLTDEVKEEFDTLLRERGEALLGCQLNSSGVAVDGEVLGFLEPGLDQTLEMIRARGQLALGDMPSETKPTTWSNRIASLVRQGFIVPIPEANKRRYRFVLE